MLMLNKSIVYAQYMRYVGASFHFPALLLRNKIKWMKKTKLLIWYFDKVFLITSFSIYFIYLEIFEVFYEPSSEYQ